MGVSILTQCVLETFHMKRGHDHRSDSAAAYRSWYKTKRWTDLREAQLRKQPLCERHLAKGEVVAATVAHHKIPHKGNAHLFWHGELASSCAPCHDMLEQKIEARGYDIGIDQTGRPVDPSHPWNARG